MKSASWLLMRGASGGGAGVAVRIDSYTTAGTEPLKGSSPYTHSHTHTPSAHMSSSKDGR